MSSLKLYPSVDTHLHERTKKDYNYLNLFNVYFILIILGITKIVSLHSLKYHQV